MHQLWNWLSEVWRTGLLREWVLHIMSGTIPLMGLIALAFLVVTLARLIL